VPERRWPSEIGGDDSDAAEWRIQAPEKKWHESPMDVTGTTKAYGPSQESSFSDSELLRSSARMDASEVREPLATAAAAQKSGGAAPFNSVQRDDQGRRGEDDGSSPEDRARRERNVLAALDKIRIGTRLEVFWSSDNEYYPATVIEQGSQPTRVFLSYDDGGGTEWIDLAEHDFRLLPGQKRTKEVRASLVEDALQEGAVQVGAGASYLESLQRLKELERRQRALWGAGMNQRKQFPGERQ
jgi:hypothetical protein